VLQYRSDIAKMLPWSLAIFPKGAKGNQFHDDRADNSGRLTVRYVAVMLSKTWLQ
jgi:hypothetical protein